MLGGGGSFQEGVSQGGGTGRDPEGSGCIGCAELSDESLLAGLGSGDPDAAADFLRRFSVGCSA